MAPENNTDTSQGVTPASNGMATPTPPGSVIAPETAPPTPNSTVSPLPEQPTQPPDPVPNIPTIPAIPQLPPADNPVVTNSPTPPSQTSPTKPSIFKRLLRHKKIIGVVIVVLLLIAAITGAYLFGKSNEKIIIQAPAPLPINLPPQAVVVTNCEPGRGKQYILPKDIPLGPVYDVVNNKVVAVEYNFKASDLFVNGDKLSDTLIPFFKGNYKTEYFVITPGTLQAGQSQSDTPVNVAIFVVSKDEASKISCQTPAS